MYLGTLTLCVLANVSWDMVPVCSCTGIFGHCPCMFLYRYIRTLPNVCSCTDIFRHCPRVSCTGIFGHCPCMFLYRYLGPNATGMAILDVGLFSGFEANKDDLEKVRY